MRRTVSKKVAMESFVRLGQIIGDDKAKPPIPPIIPVKKTTIWMWIQIGYFPAPIKLGDRVAVWKLSEIQDWIALRSSEIAKPKPLRRRAKGKYANEEVARK